MSISKRHVTTRELLGEYLTFTPGSREIDLLEADMRTLNPTLLRDAILEGVNTRVRRSVPASDQRRLLHQIYARKVKEFSSLYPFLFAVENSLRSALADHSGAKFGRSDWWTLIRDGRLAGKTQQAFPNIWGVPVSAAFVKVVWRAMDAITNPTHLASISGPDRTDEFYYCLSLGDLWGILGTDWVMTRSMFCPDKDLGFTFARKTFDDTMRIIKDARNELYHSNPIRDRKKVVEACERILNGLNVHLGDYDADLGAARYVRVPPTVLRGTRHVIPAR
ncbi:hypothetical protein MKK63_25250 [Methylobacterium sp. J-088]|uniref:hypothetical protein n=1 Tax=Methylobacterium sp. J-088 TaxID=2836664 RepID=UPI001FB8DDE6|nr:hypothetical protein [Methylobacterium sp. J-088]MCJ2065988.1 hypothetical protein [Methylobacterium sp. J-088]